MYVAMQCSLSIPGLQTLIDKATDYITMYGLKI